MIELHQAQHDFVVSDAPFIAYVGGYSSGKTQALCLRLLSRLSHNLTLAYYMPTYALIRELGIPRLTSLLEAHYPGIRCKVNLQTWTVTVPGFGRVIYRSMDAPEAIVGYEVADSFFDELDTLPIRKATEIWQKGMGRNRQPRPDKRKNSMAVATTPEGFNFVYENWGRDPRPGYELIKSRTMDNPWADLEYIAWSICSGGVSTLDADKLNELNRATSEAYLDVIKSNEWISKDFLLWLISGHTEGSIPGVSAWVDDKVILIGSNDSGELQKVTLSGTLTNRLATLKSAIKDGKQIAEATIHMEDNDGNAYKLTLDGRTFWFKGLKCPTAKMLREEGADEMPEMQAAMLYRVAGIQDAIKYLLSSHLMAFLDARLNRWGIVRDNVNEWVEEAA